MEIKVNKKEAFSLAEAMVVLVIIAIVMAMAAPLIAHKANTDQKRLIFNGVGAHIATAMGNAQNFGIGDNNPSGEENNAKLLVRAKKSDQYLVAKFISNYTPSDDTKAKKPIFQVMPKNSGDKLVNANGFQVFADGTTNAACVPDYSNMVKIYDNNLTEGNFNDYNLIALTGSDATISKYGTATAGGCKPNDYPGNVNSNYYGITFKPNQNGYLISSRALSIANITNYLTNDSDITKSFKVSEGAGKYTMHNPSMITQITKINISATSSTVVPTSVVYKYIYSGYTMVPVGKNNLGCFYYPMSKTESGISYYEDRNNVFAFVPCVK